MEEPFLEAQNQTEIYPLFFVSLGCFLSLKHWYENAILLCWLHLKRPLCHRPLATPCNVTVKAPPRFFFTASHCLCTPPQERKYIQVMTGSSATLRPCCCAEDRTQEHFSAPLSAAFGHSWSARGTAQTPGPGWGHLTCRGLLSGRWWANQASVMLH